MSFLLRLVKAVNYIVILFISIVLLIWLGNSTVDLISYARKKIDGSATQPYDYPNYKGVKWAKTYYREFNEMQAHNNYFSFVGWRRSPFKGETINIGTDYNLRKSLGESFDDSVYFLGGSTMWGSASRDIETIPSYFHKKTNMNVLNLGEGGYTSRQSLDMLLNILAKGHRPQVVISYEGVNEVAQQCRSEIKNIPAHYLENTFDRKLNTSDREIAFRYIANFFMYMPKVVQHKLGALQGHESGYECHENVKKSQAIAQNLIDNWKLLKILGDKMGFKVLTILQPHLMSAKSETSYLPKREFFLEREYASVYPTIQKFMKEQCSNNECGSNFDLSSFDFKNNPVFTDSCHMSPLGNDLITEEIVKVFNSEINNLN